MSREHVIREAYFTSVDPRRIRRAWDLMQKLVARRFETPASRTIRRDQQRRWRASQEPHACR